MKWQLLTLLIILAAQARGFEVEPGVNTTFTAHCYNASSGEFYGSNANLTVLNETGVYYSVDSLSNTGVGAFQVNLTNLSYGHCYTLELTCKDDGAWTNEHGVVCVKREGETLLAAIMLLPLIVAITLAIAAGQLNKDQHEGLRTGIFAFSFFAFTVSFHFASVFVNRVFGWVDVAENMAKYTTIVWVLFGLFILYLTAYHVSGMLKDKSDKKNERENY